jgi:hypothetical protein
VKRALQSHPSGRMRHARPTPAPAECVDPACPIAVSEVVAPIVLRLGALATSAGSVGGWVRPYRDPEAGLLGRHVVRGPPAARHPDRHLVHPAHRQGPAPHRPVVGREGDILNPEA